MTLTLFKIVAITDRQCLEPLIHQGSKMVAPYSIIPSCTSWNNHIKRNPLYLLLTTWWFRDMIWSIFKTIQAQHPATLARSSLVKTEVLVHS